MEENSPLESTRSSEDSYDWTSRRKTTEIIDSVKKRVAMHKSPTNEQNIDSVDDSPKKNLSLDNKLEELMPERRSLSPAAQNSLSLDRNRGRSLFKSAPTYSTLECMFGPSVSNSPSIYSAFDSNNSLYSSFRSCRSGILGLPQKLSCRCEKSSEHAALDDEKPKADEREREREGETESPTRPGYFKSISSPSKIFNFVRRHKSTESSGSSFDENGDHLDSTVSEHFKDPPSNVPMSITLETGDDEKKRRSELEEIEEALKSPTLQKSSFRKRSDALSAEDRPRSSSAPNSPSPRVRQRADVEEISSL